ncbi:DUF1648 domain-containing protein [Neobacillus mesonae]|uniref:DUF1648 domain-containing protein n=1 Tax=Neobacillus mesonae TaxID=1193713 RepID=UPI0020404C0D|nr:DUF1648 domain-containing protein [Neobacillus mesonae]MCM3570528.1 DUF1648 domain-containing protein [Neobacillus mesonae]
MLLFLILMMIPLYIPTIFIPYWTRKTESFGVSIPEEAYQRTDLKKMRKNYAWITSILAVITTAILLLTAGGQDENFIGILYSILISAYVIVTFFVYLIFHGKMKKLKSQYPEWTKKQQVITVSTHFRREKLTYSNFWFVIPFLISIATIAFTLLNYQQIPDRFPTQYNFSGEITTWTNKSYRSVLLMPIMQIYLTLLFLFINIVISKAKQQVSAANPEESLKQNITFRRRWSLFTILMGTGLIIVFMLPQFSLIYPISHQLLMYVPLAYALIACGGSIILSITTGQGGSRVRSTAGINGQVIDRDDDRYWKLGMFYFNPKDPAIFLEKRFGIGWTNNWAHPLSWIFIIVVILLAFGLPKLLG